MSAPAFIPLIVYKIQNQIRAKGPHTVRQLTRQFEAADPEFTGKLDRHVLGEVFQAAGLFLDVGELQRVSNELQGAYPELLNMLNPQLSLTRQAHVDGLWQALGGEGGEALAGVPGTGSVAVADVLGKMDVGAHPGVRFGGQNFDTVAYHWQLAFDGLGDSLDYDKFKTAWIGICSMFPAETDSELVEIFKACWGIRILLGSKDAIVDKAENVLRCKILHKQQKLNEYHTVMNAFKFKDSLDLGYVTLNEFSGVLERLGLFLPVDEAQAFFGRYAEECQHPAGYTEARLHYLQWVPAFLSKANSHHTLNVEFADGLSNTRLSYG